MSDCRCSYAEVATTGRHHKDCPVYMQERIATLEKAQRWIPVSERLPDDEREVLCMYQGVYGPIVSSFWRDRGGRSHFSSQSGSQPITHWLPLPAPPEAI